MRSIMRLRLLSIISHATGAITLLIGSLVLLGWMLDSITLKRLHPSLPVMVPNTAVAFVCSGIALQLIAAGRTTSIIRHLRPFNLFVATTALLIGALTLAQYALQINLGIDQLLLPQPVNLQATFPGRPSANTALNFMLLGIALLLLNTERLICHWLAHLLALVVSLNALRVLLGHIYQLTGIDPLAPNQPVALHTALAFIILAVGILCVRPERAFMSLVGGDGVGGTLLRRLLIASILLPSAAQGIEIWVERAGIFGTDFSLALLVLLNIMLFWWMAYRLDRLDRKRQQAEESIRQSEARYRAIVEDQTELIRRFRPDGTLTFVNDAYCRYVGASRESLIGSMLPSKIELTNGEQPAAEHRPAAGGVQTFEQHIQMPNGEGRWQQWTNHPIYNPQGELIELQSVGRDITEQKRAEAQIKQQLSQLAGLRMIDLAITGSLDLRVTLNVVLDQVTAQLHVDAADVLLLNQHSNLLTCAASRGLRYTHAEIRGVLGEGVAGQIAMHGQPTYVPDLRNAPFLRADLLAKEQFISYYGLPLTAKGRIIGVLEVFHRAPLVLDGIWESFLEALAGQAAIAIDSAALFAELQRSNTDLRLAYDATIAGWSRALDLRDNETEGHSQRVTERTLQLARSVGIDEAELVHVRRGALLHDIGKLAIPDRILCKPGPLTDDEWQVMRQHPVYAYQMLAPINYLRPALDIPYCHHERWNGSGYPRGLSGEQIPLVARIFSVVDVWDALRVDRPYRRAWPEERVRQYIRDQTGAWFDPQIVDLFLKEAH